ncbi:hypothetical protein [Roseivivax isoporae]|uniref:Uncharacterized protein n=1 Tax=Roseivivax isoporae LMG 25204 TaxID=1449351 RepID=X7F2Y3_9RHOB|nr:hypothetical protein [Roseivivax isoporae]ETX27282.1 hypothetical protein RISW2_14880 [Roseivivax isoporae LMG 25204]
MDPLTPSTGAGPASPGRAVPPPAENGVVERMKENVARNMAQADRMKAETEKLHRETAGQGAATAGYRMAQILGLPDAPLSVLRKG